MMKLWKAVGAGLAITFMAAFGFFSLTQDWRMALWCLGASIVAIIVALILDVAAEGRNPK